MIILDFFSDLHRYKIVNERKEEDSRKKITSSLIFFPPPFWPFLPSFWRGFLLDIITFFDHKMASPISKCYNIKEASSMSLTRFRGECSNNIIDRKCCFPRILKFHPNSDLLTSLTCCSQRGLKGKKVVFYFIIEVTASNQCYFGFSAMETHERCWFCV